MQLLPPINTKITTQSPSTDHQSPSTRNLSLSTNYQSIKTFSPEQRYIHKEVNTFAKRRFEPGRRDPMLASDLINDDIPPLKIQDSAEKALRWMDEFHVSHLPVINGTQFIGMISDDELYDLNDQDAPIGSHKLALLKPHLLGGQHPYDVLKLMAELSLDVVAISDEAGNFIGSVTLPQLAEKLSSLAAVREPGGILVLEVNNVDYSLAQIAQIVEGNDAKILSAYVAGIPDSTKVEVTLKVNRDDLTRILQTFSRYNYTVKATFHQSSYEEDMRSRYDEFMNYINM